MRGMLENGAQMGFYATLVNAGWKLIHEYGDGVVKFRKGDLQVFIDPDARAGGVHTIECLYGSTELRSLGLDVAGFGASPYTPALRAVS